MPSYPTIGAAAGFLRRDLKFTVWCSCGVGFERGSRAEAERAQADHAAEMREPADHAEVPF